MNRGLVVLLILFLLFPLACLQASGDDWSDGVMIVIYGTQYGTGWWVNNDHVVTAAHVVGYRNGTIVTLVKGSWVSQGYTIYVNSKTDVAVIRVDDPPLLHHVFPLASSVDTEKKLYVVGYPFELVQITGDLKTASETPRIAEGFAAWYRKDYSLIEFQATTDAGNSGGPVVYGNGAVAGLVSFALVGKAGTLYFASDAEAIKNDLRFAGIEFQTLEPMDAVTSNTGLIASDNWKYFLAVSIASVIISAVAVFRN